MVGHVEERMADHEQLLTLASEITSAHVSNHAIVPHRLPSLIQQVFNTLATMGQKTAEPPKPDPAIPIWQSVRPDHLVCLECGRHFSMFKRHLGTDYQLTPEQYRERWCLPVSYLVAPNYAKVRPALAKKIGLGRKGMFARKTAGRARGRDS